MTWQPPCSATGRGASKFSFVLRFMTEWSCDLACSSFQHAVRGSLARSGVRPVHPRRCRLHKCYRAVVIAVIVAIKTGSTASRGLGGRNRTKDDASCLIKHHVISHEMQCAEAQCGFRNLLFAVPFTFRSGKISLTKTCRRTNQLAHRKDCTMLHLCSAKTVHHMHVAHMFLQLDALQDALKQIVLG